MKSLLSRRNNELVVGTEAPPASGKPYATVDYATSRQTMPQFRQI